MARDLVDVLATDLAVTALAERAPLESDDAALRLLEAWAADIDARPIAVDVEPPEPTSVRRRPRGAARSVVAMTVVLTLSSTGIAAAVQGNPFAPINYVVDKFGHLGHHDRTSPVDLLGTRNAPLDDPSETQARARVEHNARPSRGGPAGRPGSAHAGARASAPIVSHRLPNSGGAGEVREPRERQRLLVVRRPHHGPTVHNPRPHGGETPPTRPELAGPIQPPWPKPTGERPAPPDKPMSSDSGSAPVR